MVKIYLLVLLLTLGSSFKLWAAGGASGAAGKQGKVLDFEADLIEGERNAPSVFIEMDIHRASIDSVLFQRNNFNDFHAAEKNRRPKYLGPKATTTPSQPAAPAQAQPQPQQPTKGK